MEVRMGISTDYAKEKFDITLDEADLARLCGEHDISDSQANAMTVAQVFLLLSKEAERYVLVQAPKFGRPAEQVQEQLAQNREDFAKILVSVKGAE